MSFRNRCLVSGAGGPILLSVPLSSGRDQKIPTGEVRIANRQPWQSQHWKTIISCYNRSPWFEFYRDELAELYSRPFDRLVDWDLACFTWTLQKLGWSLPVGLTEEKVLEVDPAVTTDARNRFLPRNPKRTFPPALRYRQVFEDRLGFQPHLSILDLLFCEGKNALTLLQKAALSPE